MVFLGNNNRPVSMMAPADYDFPSSVLTTGSTSRLNIGHVQIVHILHSRNFMLLNFEIGWNKKKCQKMFKEYWKASIQNRGERFFVLV